MNVVACRGISVFRRHGHSREGVGNGWRDLNGVSVRRSRRKEIRGLTAFANELCEQVGIDVRPLSNQCADSTAIGATTRPIWLTRKRGMHEHVTTSFVKHVSA